MRVLFLPVHSSTFHASDLSLVTCFRVGKSTIVKSKSLGLYYCLMAE